MKIKIMQQDAPVYPQSRPDATPMRVLHLGDQAEAGKFRHAKGQSWLEIIFPDKTRGFMPGNTRFFSLGTVVTNQPETQLYATAGRESPKATLKKGTRLEFLDLVEQMGEKWIRVQDKTGETGFIEENTKVIRVAKPTLSAGIYNTVIGAVAVLAGICSLLGLLGMQTIDWVQIIIRILWFLMAIGWFIAGIVQIVEASKK